MLVKQLAIDAQFLCFYDKEQYLNPTKPWGLCIIEKVFASSPAGKELHQSS